MASIDIPIKVNLPDNWAEIVAEKLKQDDDYVLVTRCKDCKFWSDYTCFCEEHDIRCQDYYIGDMHTESDDFCSRAERKEQKE